MSESKSECCGADVIYTFFSCDTYGNEERWCPYCVECRKHPRKVKEEGEDER